VPILNILPGVPSGSRQTVPRVSRAHRPHIGPQRPSDDIFWRSPTPPARTPSPREDNQARPPPRIPKTTSVDDAIRYWEMGDESRGLDLPLKVWVFTYKPSEYRSQAQKLSMIGIVRAEFAEVCSGDWEVFERRYPGLRYQYTKLVKAVRVARIARGDTKSRHPNKK
jgi:hypothetical protein